MKMYSFFPPCFNHPFRTGKILQSQTHPWQNDILGLGQAISLKKKKRKKERKKKKKKKKHLFLKEESFVLKSIITTLHTMKYNTRIDYAHTTAGLTLTKIKLNKRSQTKGYRLYDSIYMWFKTRQNQCSLWCQKSEHSYIWRRCSLTKKRQEGACWGQEMFCILI